MVVNTKFEIPANAPHYRVDATRTLEQDEEMQILMPHTHVRGSGFGYEAVYPDGKKEVLLDVPTYDFNWQNSYVLAEPKVLPRGTELSALRLLQQLGFEPGQSQPEHEGSLGRADLGRDDDRLLRSHARPEKIASRIRPAAPKPYVAPVYQALDPELEKLAKLALTSQEAFEAFAKAVHEKLPQVDRLCVTSVTDGNLWVQHSAYPGKKIPHIAETGFKQHAKVFLLTALALFNDFKVQQDMTTESARFRHAADEQDAEVERARSHHHRRDAQHGELLECTGQRVSRPSKMA